MIQNFTYLLGKRWGSKLIGFRMMFPTLIFNRSLSLIDSRFQRTVNFFHCVQSHVAAANQFSSGLSFFDFSMLCLGFSRLLFFVNYCKVFDTNGMTSHDENLVLLWHILRISILQILKKILHFDTELNTGKLNQRQISRSYVILFWNFYCGDER